MVSVARCFSPVYQTSHSVSGKVLQMQTVYAYKKSHTQAKDHSSMSLSEFGWLWKHQNNQACTVKVSVCKVLKLATTQMKAFLIWPQDITWHLWQVIWCFTPSQPLQLYQGESLAKHSSSAYSTSLISLSELLICQQNSVWHLCQSFLSAHRFTAYDIYVRASYLPSEQPMTSMSTLLICPQNSLWHLCQSF